MLQLQCLKGSTIHLQTETNPLVAPESPANAIRRGHRLKYGVRAVLPRCWTGCAGFERMLQRAVGLRS